MGSRSFVWTSAGGETAGHTIGNFPLPTFTGPFTISISASSPSPAVARFGVDIYPIATGPVCLSDNLVFVTGDTAKTNIWTVGVPGGSWHCSTWDTCNWYVAGPTSPIGAGITWTLTVDGPGIPAGSSVCMYGTEPIDPSIKVVDLIPAAIAIFRNAPDKRWALLLAMGTLAKPILLDAFCALPPPEDPTINWEDFNPQGLPFVPTVAQQKAGIKIRRAIWDLYCHCKPATGGGAAPVGPGATDLTKPTYYITNTDYTISNYDISTTLSWIYNIGIQNSYTTNNQYTDSHDVSITTTNTNTTVNELAAATTCPPAAYVDGTVHDSLSGAGRIAIDQVVGFRVEVLEHDTSKPVLTGDPPYLWDVGWVSILGIGDELVDEHRVTREAYLWFPCAIMHATEFAYRLRDFSVCRVTELVVPGGGLEPP